MIFQEFRKHYKVMDESVFSRLPGSFSKDKDQWKMPTIIFSSCTKPQENCNTVSSQMNAWLTGLLKAITRPCIPRFNDLNHPDQISQILVLSCYRKRRGLVCLSISTLSNMDQPTEKGPLLNAKQIWIIHIWYIVPCKCHTTYIDEQMKSVIIVGKVKKRGKRVEWCPINLMVIWFLFSPQFSILYPIHLVVIYLFSWHESIILILIEKVWENLIRVLNVNQ